MNESLTGFWSLAIQRIEFSHQKPRFTCRLEFIVGFRQCLNLKSQNRTGCVVTSGGY